MSVLVVDGGSTVPNALVCSLGVISVLVTLGMVTAVDVVLSGGLVMVVGVVTAKGVETVVAVATEVVGSCKQLFPTIFHYYIYFRNLLSDLHDSLC